MSDVDGMRDPTAAPFNRQPNPFTISAVLTLSRFRIVQWIILLSEFCFFFLLKQNWKLVYRRKKLFKMKINLHKKNEHPELVMAFKTCR